jgi:hypothetical protein
MKSNKYEKIMKQLNKLFGFDPPMVSKDFKNEEEFIQEVKDVIHSPDTISPDDKISSELGIFLNSHGIIYNHKRCPDYVGEDQEIKEEIKEESKIEEKPKVEKKGKLTSKKEAEEALEKDVKTTKIVVLEKEEKKKKPKKKKEKKFTRADAFAKVIKKGGTRDDLIIAANALYIEQGGAGSISNATVYHNYAISILEAMGIIELNLKTKKYSLKI